MAWKFGIHSYTEVLVLGLFLGVAGAAFAVALPLASRWYPPEHQGTALGIAGAGNSGTALAALFGLVRRRLRLGERLRPRPDPCASSSCFYLMIAKDAPSARRPSPSPNTSRCCGTRIPGGSCSSTRSPSAASSAWPRPSPSASTPIRAGSEDGRLLHRRLRVCRQPGAPHGRQRGRPIGGIKTPTVMYVLAAIFLTIVSFGLPEAWMALAIFVCAMLSLGMGNGAVFQLVPQRFQGDRRDDRPVGMAGGVGGFYLASSLGYSNRPPAATRPAS